MRMIIISRRRTDTSLGTYSGLVAVPIKRDSLSVNPDCGASFHWRSFRASRAVVGRSKKGDLGCWRRLPSRRDFVLTGANSISSMSCATTDSPADRRLRRRGDCVFLEDVEEVMRDKRGALEGHKHPENRIR